jgi:hypothetical protein
VYEKPLTVCLGKKIEGTTVIVLFLKARWFKMQAVE